MNLHQSFHYKLLHVDEERTNKKVKLCTFKLMLRQLNVDTVGSEEKVG